MSKRKNIKRDRHFFARKRYQEKRYKRAYHRKRRIRLHNWFILNPSIRDYKKKDENEIIKLPAPRNFSFINNTEAMLEYLHESRRLIVDKKRILLDISKVSKMTPDSIAVVISTITSPIWNHKINIKGNAPEDKRLCKLFIESGFYNYVKSSISVAANGKHLMHKEMSLKVKPNIAGNAVRQIMANHPLNEDEMDAVYTIIIELMSNTLHHASLETYGVSNWWMYVCAESRENTSVTFIDLGVGIFKSLPVKSYVREIGKAIGLISNVDYVADLLSGRIGSRIKVDRDIRGKGIQQIVKAAKMECFSKFYIITNDVKIDMKSEKATELKNKFRGTFVYFELYNRESQNGNQRHY